MQERLRRHFRAFSLVRNILTGDQSRNQTIATRKMTYPAISFLPIPVKIMKMNTFPYNHQNKSVYNIQKCIQCVYLSNFRLTRQQNPGLQGKKYS